VGQKSDTLFNYVNITPGKLQNRIWFEKLQHLLLSTHSLNVFIYLTTKLYDTFGTPVFLHMQTMPQTAYIVS